MGELEVDTIGDNVLGSIFIIFKLVPFELVCSFSFVSFVIPYIGFTPDAGLPKYRGIFFILKIFAGLDGMCLLVPSETALCVLCISFV